MSYKMKDFCCNNLSCDKYNKVFEKFVYRQQIAICEVCGLDCKELISATAGRVNGGTPKFHVNSLNKSN